MPHLNNGHHETLRVCQVDFVLEDAFADLIGGKTLII